MQQPNSMPPTWLADPVGRHDARFWSGDHWTDDVADDGVPAVDPIGSIDLEPVTIRPSWSALRKTWAGLPLWRRLISVLFLPFFVLLLGAWGGWLAVGLVGGSCLALLIAWPVLYFNVVFIRASADGIEHRNQVGYKKVIPRGQVGTVSVGRAWAGGLNMSDFVFVASPAGQQLARFYLQYWSLDDFRRAAGALGLCLYGAPGRRIDEFHSGRTEQRSAMLLGGSVVVGAALGIGIPLLLVIGLAIALVFAHFGR